MKVDVTGVLFLVAVVAICIITKGITAVFGVPFGIIMFLLIRKFGGKVGLFILNREYQSFLALRKFKIKASAMFNETFRHEHKGFSGVMNVALRITWIGLGVGLLSLRFILNKFSGFVQEGVETIGMSEIALIGILAAVIGTLLSPMAVPYWVINSSRVRIIHLKKGTISMPGSFLRGLFKGLFGVGNIAAFAYFVLASIRVADNDVVMGLKIAGVALLVVFGIVGFAAIVASTLLLFKGLDVLNKTLLSYEEKYSSVSVTEDELIEFIKGCVRPPSEVAEEKTEAQEQEVPIGKQTSEEETSEEGE